MYACMYVCGVWSDSSDGRASDCRSMDRWFELGSYCSGPGGYYSGTLVTVVTAVLKAVSLSGGHTVATELPTSIEDQAK